MNTVLLHALPGATAVASLKPLHRPHWKTVLRRFVITSIVAPLVLGPVVVMAIVAGPPIPVTINGVVGNGVDAVDLNGQMMISTRIISDLEFSAPPILELVIDFSSVKGNGRDGGKGGGKGSGKGSEQEKSGKGNDEEKFVTEAQAIIRRPLLALDPVEVTFPYTSGNNPHSARTAVATLMVSFSAASGLAITSKVKDVKLD